MSNRTRCAMVLMITAGLFGFSPVSNAAEEPVPSMTVVGSGKASAKPDQGEINVGVVTQRPTAVDAMSENSAAVRKVMQRLSELGIAAEDIRTNNLNLNPVYARREQGQDAPRIVGYEVTNQVHILVRNLDRMGSVLDAVVREGANRLHGVSFAVGDPTSLLDEARKNAIEDAHRKAEIYAAAAAVKLGPVLSVQEGQPNLPPADTRFRLAQAAESVPIAPGQLDFQVAITVTYRIGPGEAR